MQPLLFQSWNEWVAFGGSLALDLRPRKVSFPTPSTVGSPQMGPVINHWTLEFSIWGSDPTGTLQVLWSIGPCKYFCAGSNQGGLRRSLFQTTSPFPARIYLNPPSHPGKSWSVATAGTPSQNLLGYWVCW